jgi:hypothetical protein
MYSDEDVATYAEPTLECLRQSELLTGLMQEAIGNMRPELTHRSRSPREESPN